MDTPELDHEYREARHYAYYILRKNNEMKGGSALKKLEKLFRTYLWETNYGKQLQKKYAEIPGQVRASIPLVEYIVDDAKKPVFNLLIEFCKSANTRALIDDIIRLLSNTTTNSSDRIIKTIIYGKYDDATQKRINQAFNRAKLEHGNKQLFEIPTSLISIPVSPRDILISNVQIIEEGGGKFFIANYPIIVPNIMETGEYEIVIIKVFENYAIGKLAELPQQEDL